QIDSGIELNVAQRVKGFDRDVEFFGEELRRVRHDGGATRQEEPLGGRAALLATIKLHGLVDLDVQAGHELAGDLGDGRLVRVLRLFVGATQADEALFDLEFFGHVELVLGFTGEVLGDRVGAQVNAAGKHFALFKEQQVAGLGADVQKHGAIFQIAVVVTKRVAQGRWRHIRQLQMQAGAFGHPEQELDDVALDRHQPYFKFAAWG